jgi:signal transduction histidine kinase/CheY-like chemotaxis protein
MNPIKGFHLETLWPFAKGPQRTDRFRAEQVRMLYRSGPVGVVGGTLGAFGLAVVVLHLGARSLRAIELWLVVMVVTAVVHLLLARAYHRSSSQVTQWRRWAGWFTAVCLIEGLNWGATAIYSASPQDMVSRLLTMALICAITSGSLPAFGFYLPAFYVLFFPATIPFAVVGILQGGLVPYVLALLTVLYILTMFGVCLWYHSNFMETLNLRFENLDLADSLRLQKEAAEEANHAKSRFLAAASHDLRQPVHALSMFVGALRGHEMQPEPRRLLDHIDASVTAMDGLFTALLDISRLDAGEVEPRLQSFAIRPLFERLSRDYVEEAARKGISLRFHASSANVSSDPLLLERILRNLISNAIRYTDCGRVVVGCRRRDRLELQIWDTGRGIPPQHAENVFQEFFQLHNPERDRAKGLGLGLAIVRRLTTLLDHPMTMSSTPGKGSLFSVSLPMTETVDLPEVPGHLPSGAFRRGLILVIDDETAIQEAMRSLLTSWGHEVIWAGSGAEILDKIASCPTRPDLIICDYRLRGEESGITVIRELQSEYNEEIPGLLITGDTAPDRLNEARHSGFLLLHKPVASSKLRAAIGNLIAPAESRAGDLST